MIKLVSITKRFGERLVIDSLSLVIQDGQKIAVMGESGKGKTTLLRIIAGLETPDSGSVCGYNKEELSYVFQEPRLFETISAIKNLTAVSTEPYKTAEKKAMELLALVGLEKDAKKQPRELSGGMKQRLALARAFMVDCPILLLDEPFSALDEDTKNDIIALVKEKTKDKTVILVTHDREDALKLCDSIYTL